MIRELESLLPASSTISFRERLIAHKEALEKLEKLLAALVLVDASNVDRKCAPDPVFLAKTVGPGPLGHVRTDADYDAGKVAPGGVLQHRPLFV